MINNNNSSRRCRRSCVDCVWCAAVNVAVVVDASHF